MRVVTLLLVCLSCLFVGTSYGQQSRSAMHVTLEHFEPRPFFPVPHNHWASPTGKVLFANLLDSVHYTYYQYDTLNQLTGIQNSWNYHQYNDAGQLMHSYFADFPKFDHARRISFSYPDSGFSIERKFRTRDGISQQAYPNAALVNSLLNPLPYARTDQYTHDGSRKSDTVITWVFNSPSDSTEDLRVITSYTSSGQLSSRTEHLKLNHGAGSQWYIKQQERYYYDSQGRDTLYLLHTDSNYTDTLVLPYRCVRTVYVDSLKTAARYYALFNSIDQVYTNYALDSLRFDSNGILQVCDKYTLNQQTLDWDYDGSDQYKLVQYGFADSLMKYSVLGTDTVYGDNFTYVFNLHNQLVSVIGWAEDVDQLSYYRRIEYKYVYNEDGSLSRILHYSYPDKNTSTIILDGYYQFYYSIHTLGLNPSIGKRSSEAVLYPNPGNGQLQFRSTERVEQVMVYNANGQLVHTEQKARSTAGSIHLQYLPKGLYFVLLFGQNGKSSTTRYVKTY